MVAKGDVRSHWPFSESPETSTGLPGRPAKAKHLIGDECNGERMKAALLPASRKRPKRCWTG